jgi:hypothetical protein
MSGDSPDDEIYFCTTEIEAISADGQSTSTGTGFVVEKDVPGKGTALFIVTCRHVVEGFAQAKITFVAEKDGKPLLGQKCEAVIGDLPQAVFYNKDNKVDVAIIPLIPLLDFLKTRGESPFFRALNVSFIPSDKDAADLSSIQNILFAGYPIGIRDEKNILPIVRRGTTATPYSVDYNGLPLFLIDAAVFPGSSGSPVLVFDQGSISHKNGSISIGTRFFFLGLIAQSYLQEEKGIVQFESVPTALVPTYKESIPVNLGVVIKAQAVLETIDEELGTQM